MTHPIWKIFLGAALSVVLVACGSKVIPVFSGKIYSLDPIDLALKRSQEGEVLFIEDLPDDSSWVVFSSEDFEVFVNTYITNCKGWVNPEDTVQMREEMRRHDPR